MRKTLIASVLAAPLLVAAAATPATAASSSSPAQTCKTGVLAGPFGEVPLTGEGGYFFKQGGCASTVAAGGLDGGPAQLSALTSRAGYVQTCQLIREVEGFPFDFGYPFIPFDQEVASIGECADVLKMIHNFGA